MTAGVVGRLVSMSTARHIRTIGASVLGAALLSACRTGRPAPGAAWCPARVPPGQPPFAPAQATALAGTYDLLMVGDNETGRGHVERGALRLWVQDAARRARGTFGPARPGFERILGAAYERVPADSGRAWRVLASRDPDRPGGVFMRGRLRLGAHDVLDGTGEELTVLYWTADGFRGRWASDLGIAVMLDRKTGRTLPNPGGYFCARRRPGEGGAPGPERVVAPDVAPQAS